VTLVVMWVLV